MLLPELINRNSFPAQDRLKALINPEGYYKLKSREYCKYNVSPNTTGDLAVTVSATPYQGTVHQVLEMQDFLNRELKEDLLGAYIHGSLAVDERVAYSDFDALVILKQEVVESPERLYVAAQKLYSIQRLMKDFDPIQHHGWFVLSEHDLKNYPQTYFPYELFEFSRSIFANGPASIDLLVSSEIDFKNPLVSLAKNLIDRIAAGRKLSTLYQLKGMLSEVMLLPSLYYQARHKKGVFKKHSFEMVKSEFPAETWKIMEEVSKLRENWDQQLSSIEKSLITHSNFVIRKWAKKNVGSIPGEIQKKLNQEFYQRISVLSKEMIANINT